MFDGAVAAATTAVAANQPVIRKQKHLGILINLILKKLLSCLDRQK